ncbi:hypothetical protein [Roseateles chitosanitabidus]|jgi:hypothetical protein|uniref:hypothetical protein n=1 Tax=Roseateles chitosanitabidus TaxID=65048 RepID=UPI00082CE93A|nr:hypothetical protein [Roseateles chitosanitabidus]MBO9685580.1 hypothetical protein [Roseateles chitosanitabidus]
MSASTGADAKPRALVALIVLALGVVAAIVFLRAKPGATLSIEDKVNLSAVAHRICKAAAVDTCPISWVSDGKGGAAIAGQVGRPIASREQLRGVLPAPQWRESADEATVFRNGKYAVSIEAATGVILIAPQ